MKLYLSGPMRGLPEFNFPAFALAASLLRAHGHEVHSPAEHDLAAGFDPTGLTGDEALDELGFDLTDAMRHDLAFIINEAEGVALLPGWWHSDGAKTEAHVAQITGKVVAEILDHRLIEVDPDIRLEVGRVT